MERAARISLDDEFYILARERGNGCENARGAVMLLAHYSDANCL